MSKILKTVFAASLPAAFLLSGAGILWLYTTLDPDLSFFERLQTHEAAWNGAHVLLFAGSVLLIPAALGLWQLVRGKKGAVLAEIGLVLVMVGAFFQAGQYAIDFVMPLLAQTGGEEAIAIHRGLFSTPLVNIPFYNLPELTFLGLLALTGALAWSGSVSRNYALVLFGVWAVVIAANILGYLLVGRLAALALGFVYVPVAKKLYSSLE